MYSKVFLLDGRVDVTNTFTISIDDTLLTELRYDENNNSKVCGNIKNDNIYEVWSRCAHSANTMKLKLDCNSG